MLLCAAAVLAVACSHEQASDFRMMIRLAWHEEHAAKMALAADKMRAAGIIPSIQEVVLGHGDGMTVFDVMKDSTIHWGTMVGPDGRRPMLVLKRKGHRDRTLKTVRDGDDLIVSVPGLDAWEFAWIALSR
jgi:hypothetical protein